MLFEEAFPHLRAGRKIARRLESNIKYLILKDNKINTGYIRTTDGKNPQLVEEPIWWTSDEDILSDDWEIIT